MTPMIYSRAKGFKNRTTRRPEISETEIAFNQKVIESFRETGSIRNVMDKFQMHSTIIYRILRQSGDLGCPQTG